jgi:ABC-type lipoprotein export system ATPase subunit
MPAELATSLSATWYARLKAQTSAPDIARWCDWSRAHDEELENLQARLLEKNPAEQAKQLRTRKIALERLSKELIAFRDGLTDAAVATLLDAKANAATKRKAASEDAKNVFDGAPLDGVGLESWKLLWQQARAYSEEVAYLEKEFPFTGDDARCVLCQQSLSEEAKLRLVSFETFVNGELESLAQKAEADVAALLQKLPKIPAAEDFTTRLTTLGLDDEELTQELHQFRNDAHATRDALSAATSSGQVPSTPNATLIDEFGTLSAALEIKAKAFDEDAKKTDKTELKKKARELEARKWLNEQKVSVDEEIMRLKKIAALEAARKLTNITALSKKKSDLAQVLVSDAFIQRFDSELKALSAARIQVELVQSRTDKGHVFHQIRLKNAKVFVPTSDVLSEGERSVVSLAAFVADVEGIDANTPIVFDDPITSLDQDFEESVVARFVALAKKRQVIVFTHRLSMLTQLEDAAKLVGSHPHHPKPVPAESQRLVS